MGDLAECPPLPGWLTGAGAAIPYVEVYSQTEAATGGSILPYTFGQMLTGNSGITVGACARAAWGAPGAYTGTIPITFSACEWKYFMDDYGGYVAALPGPNGYGSGAGQTPWPDVSKEKVIYLKADQNSGEPKPCMWNNMNDFPGGFGYVAQSSCKAQVTTNGWVDAITGGPLDNACKPEMPKLYNTVVALPVFDCVQPGGTAPTTSDVSTLSNCATGVNGTKAWYHIAGWAKFYVSGYKFPGNANSRSSPNLGIPCNSNESCLSGWFVKGSLDATSIVPPGGGGTDFGTYTVLPAG